MLVVWSLQWRNIEYAKPPASEELSPIIRTGMDTDANMIAEFLGNNYMKLSEQNKTYNVAWTQNVMYVKKMKHRTL